MSTTGAPSLVAKRKQSILDHGDRRSHFAQDEPSWLGESEDRGLHRIATRTGTSTDDQPGPRRPRAPTSPDFNPDRLRGAAGGRSQPGQLQPDRQQGRRRRPSDGDRAPRACLRSHARRHAALRAHQRAQPDARARHLRRARRLALQRAARAAHGQRHARADSTPSSPPGRPTAFGMPRSSRSSSRC